jgi:hypothetical protein
MTEILLSPQLNIIGLSARTIYILYPLVGFELTTLGFFSASALKQLSADNHVAPRGHIILIPNHTVFALTP